MHYLLSHRPTNHELWNELGKLHEKRGENDEAWLCYDNAQEINPSNHSREKFLQRISKKFVKNEKWIKPDLNARVDFDKRMEKLAKRLNLGEEKETESSVIKQEEVEINADVSKLDALIEKGDLEVAFFLSRKLLTQGEGWAKEYFEKCKKLLNEVGDTNV